MTRRFVLRPRAENDIQSAFEWYESQRSGLGEQFLTAVRERLEAVRSFPESNSIIYRDVRRAVVSRFPYSSFMLCGRRELRSSPSCTTRAIPQSGHVGNVLANSRWNGRAASAALFQTPRVMARRSPRR